MAMNCEGEYGHLIMQDLILPATHSAPEVMASYARFGRRQCGTSGADPLQP